MSTTEPMRLLTARAAAQRLAISTRKLWELTQRRELPSIRIGRAVRYAPDDLAAFIDAQRVGIVDAAAMAASEPTGGAK